jgi:hypothetical protein
MKFISAGALWWLWLSAPIIILYLLKVRRTRHVVSSVLLWRRAIQEMEANVPFRKLRQNLLLILQLAALILIVLALSRPSVTSHALAQGSTVIVVDASASMGARDENDGSATRLERAKELVNEMLRGVGGPTRAALVEAAARPRLVCPLTSERPRLAAGLDEIKQTDETGDLHDAMLLGAELAKAQQSSEVVVITDGAGGGGAIDQKEARIRFLRVGRRANNVGIVAMNTRPLPGGRQELFASVANFGDTERTVQADLRVNGVLIDVRTLNLGPALESYAGGTGQDGVSNRRSLIFDSLPPDGGVAELKLDVDDDLPADNVAYAIVSSSRRPAIGVTSPNRFVWQALATNPDIEPRRVQVQAGQESDLEHYDVVIAEGDQVSSALKSTRSLLCINPGDVPGLVSTEGGVQAPASSGNISTDPSHPVNSYISYGAVNFDRRRVLKVAGWLNPIVSDSAGGLIWAGQDKGRRVIVLGFDLSKTDLPVRMEFPILIANSIAWLSQGAGGGPLDGALNQAVRTGQPLTLQSASPRITIQRPDGSTIQAETHDGVATFADTARVGVYTAKEANSRFAVSLLSGLESDTRPRDSLSGSGGKIQSSSETYKSYREIWTWVLCGALVVLGAEWLVYLRRALGG